MFGDLENLLESDKNPETLLRRLREQGEPVPDIYMACGTEDFLLEPNRRFAAFLKSQNIWHKYEETAGAHEWKFWDAQIEKVLQWLPLEWKVSNYINYAETGNSPRAAYEC